MNHRITPRNGSMHDYRARARSAALSPIALATLSTFCHVSAHASESASQVVASLPPRPQIQDASATEFDADALRARGIDPALAAYFSQAPRFTPGSQRVSLFVNDERRGSATATFDDQGHLCFDRTLLEQAGLIVPDALKRDKAEGGKEGEGQSAAGNAAACYDYREAFPQATTDLDPGANAVRLIVPAEALNSDAKPVDKYASGGVGGVFNYNVMSMSTTGSGANSRYTLADSEFGLNAGDWIVRSRHTFTLQDGQSNISDMYTYAQKTFVRTGGMMQAGQINVSGSLFAVPSLTGVQYFPDSALIPAPAGPSFQGITNSPSRVEVHQLGMLIYSTVVPAGPFTLSNLPLTSASADVQITVTETDGGAARTYTVPAASLTAGQRAPQGLSVAVGKVRNLGSGGGDLRAPLVATASKGWNIGTRYRVATGALVAQDYQALAGSLDVAVSGSTSANVQSLMSNSQVDHARGFNVSTSASTQLTDTLSASFSATQQTPGYRSLADTTNLSILGTPYARTRSQYTASANWSHPLLGGFAMSYSYASNYNAPSSQYATLGWNRMFGRVTASLNLQKSFNRQSYSNGAASLNNDLQFYATLSIPLGSVNVQGYSTNTGGRTRFGTSVSQTVNDYWNYSARAETNPGADGPNLSGTVNVLPRYTQASMSYSQSGWSNGAYTGQLQGGVVATREGVTFSPYAIGDTFGVVSAGELSGVRISTPQGTVWTDPRGRAVVPMLPAYQRSRIEVLTKSLPRNADLNNGIDFVDAGRGSVNFVNFGVVKTRRVLLRVTTPDGVPLPPSLAVLDDKDQYLTTSVGDGVVFLNNDAAKNLHVKLSDDKICKLRYELPVKPDLDRPFDSTTAVCDF
ncbi:pilus assembly protein PapC [Trinickia terrae]|uniref:Pilus assembly protein PapC n=1 Tax=Trinickia terrae TaxID=2571161 RepID=A0A4U1IBD3_9BURK|nr:fimbria/pilus outer membrane usher protein [Trinickia terrae]TKC90881.1 pilus assembly protein PapC [Trinickia terrae]